MTRNEEIYCYCKKKESEDMVYCEGGEACVNGAWCHYSCAGISEAPVGLWFCTNCQNQTNKPNNDSLDGTSPEEPVSSDGEEDYIEPTSSFKKKANKSSTLKVSFAKTTPKAAVKKSTTKASTAKKAKSKVKGKSAPTSVDDSKQEVLEYMKRTNRPYSVINVYENLHRRIGKTLLQKLMDDLAEGTDIKCKVYGKTKVYYANQNNIPLPSEVEMIELDSQIAALTDDCKNLEDNVTIHSKKLSSVSSSISDEDLERTLVNLKAKVIELRKSVEKIDDPNKEIVAPEKKDNLKRKCSELRSIWIARKKIVKQAVDQIAEGMEKSSKIVLEMCSVETDAAIGITDIPKI